MGDTSAAAVNVQGRIGESRRGLQPEVLKQMVGRAVAGGGGAGGYVSCVDMQRVHTHTPAYNMWCNRYHDRGTSSRTPAAHGVRRHSTTALNGPPPRSPGLIHSHTLCTMTPRVQGQTHAAELGSLGVITLPHHQLSSPGPHLHAQELPDRGQQGEVISNSCHTTATTITACHSW